MKMHLNTIREISRGSTKHQITGKALFLLSLRSEELIISIIQDAERLLAQRNAIRRANGLPEKTRIDDELLGEVLKSIIKNTPSAGQSPAEGIDDGGNHEASTPGAGYVETASLIEPGRNTP